MISNRLDRAALVVAHPDDEILWFSSIVQRVAKVIICYLDVPGLADLSNGRRQAAALPPLSAWTFLGIAESVAFAGADWKSPVTTEYGLEVTRRPGTLPGFDAERYRANYDLVRAKLESVLESFDVVVTHNPWGDYGNEEHVQVHRVVASLQSRLGFEMYYSNYCSNRSHGLMLREISGLRSDYETLRTDPTFAHEVENVYRRLGCWTWPFDDYVHFANESFIAGRREPGTGPGSTCPLNYIHVRELPTAPPTGSLRRAARASRRRLAVLLGAK